MFFVTTIILPALLSVFSAAASPLEYPEVIPGPGMPSLESLGLTSKFLYETTAPVMEGKRDLVARFDRLCNDNGCGRVPRADAQACINYLRNLGTKSCGVPSSLKFSTSVMCTAGKAHVIAINWGRKPVSSYCSDAAIGGQNVINGCTDANGNVAGADAANGNGDLIVAIEGCNP